ncbi:hypothetical protein B2J86_16865 [Acidovorax sp. SRB_14]|nr:hypothetical protein [Acidovorax sp. SRB_14]NMM78023.1 hypothetical protein [Acidovorax sp. SRB_24]NMM82574.1 hypothetical protein [Acidovorax sp. SRB_14]NMM91171.1 hypothetical protein [Rhodococcus sp. SRB_17]
MMDLVERGDTSKKVRNVHTIPELWALVTPAHKALIAGMFRNSTGPEIRLQVFEEALRHLGDKPFVQWRYVYEFPSRQLMSHGAISIVIDAVGHAAEYVIKRTRARQLGCDSESQAA